MKKFADNISPNDSIYGIFDKEHKNKLLTRKDIKNIINDEQKLDFGKDPYYIYNEIINRNFKNESEFYKSLKDFNIFRGRDPLNLNIKI